jgi:hypothetical protein
MYDSYENKSYIMSMSGILSQTVSADNLCTLKKDKTYIDKEMNGSIKGLLVQIIEPVHFPNW